MLRFVVTIQGPGWEDVQSVELPRAPYEGDTIETQLGTCIVTAVTPPDPKGGTGRITCRLP